MADRNAHARLDDGHRLWPDGNHYVSRIDRWWTNLQPDRDDHSSRDHRDDDDGSGPVYAHQSGVVESARELHDVQLWEHERVAGVCDVTMSPAWDSFCGGAYAHRSP